MTDDGLVKKILKKFEEEKINTISYNTFPNNLKRLLSAIENGVKRSLPVIKEVIVRAEVLRDYYLSWDFDKSEKSKQLLGGKITLEEYLREPTPFEKLMEESSSEEKPVRTGAGGYP